MLPMVQSAHATVASAERLFTQKMLEISENTILHTLTVKNAKEPMNQFYICWPKKSSKKQAE
jgi:hypothetical protein